MHASYTLLSLCLWNNCIKNRYNYSKLALQIFTSNIYMRLMQHG